MPIIATAGESKNFTPAPEGTHQAVCVDVIDRGMKPNAFKAGALQRKIDVAWQIDEARDDGKRFVVYKRYTLSLHEKSNLRKDLESWRGKAFTLAEEMGFDVETVIGANCLINVQHHEGNDRTFANVVSVMPLIRGMQKLFPSDYARVVDEDANPAGEHDPEPSDTDGPLTDDDIPF